MDKIVIDTNVLVSALRSSRGASFKLLQLTETGKFEISLSVPVLLEYESVTKRKKNKQIIDSDIDEVLNYLCKIADKRDIFFLWRPFLKDPKDDMILELAVEARCRYIITNNLDNFKGINKFGVSAITPKQFLIKLKVL